MDDKQHTETSSVATVTVSRVLFLDIDGVLNSED